MKSKVLIMVAILAMALVAAPAMATITTADLYFTEASTGLSVYTLGGAEPYFADLHITVDTGANPTGLANFTLTPGTGSYLGQTVQFVLIGTGSQSHLLGLEAMPTTGLGPFTLSLANAVGTPFAGTPTVSVFPQNNTFPLTFNQFGAFNTGLTDSRNGFPGAMTKVTFDSTQQFATADLVLAALTANLDGYKGAVDIGAYYTSGPLNGQNTGPTGSAGNGEVPIPPSVLLMGSGLVGLGLVGWRRRRK